MTAMLKFKTNVTITTDAAYVGDRVVRMFDVMCCPHCLARDVIDAETDGVGKTALRIALAEDALDALADKRVTIAINGPGTPIRFANPDDPSTFAIVMPVRC